MANNLALFTFNLLKIQKVQLAYSASSFSLFFRSFYFFWFNFIFILFISLFFLVYIYLFILYFKYNICCLYVSSTVFDSYVLCACICWFLCVCLGSMCLCLCLCVCVSCIASTDVNFNLSLYINPSIHRTANTSQRLPLFTLLFNFCIALTLKGWTECDGESVTMRYR